MSIATRLTDRATMPIRNADAARMPMTARRFWVWWDEKTGKIRLRGVDDTRSLTLCAFVEQFTHPDALVMTDDYQSYNALKRVRETVCHSLREWGRDDDGDGCCEIHTNSDEGMWTGLRNFLRPFRGVHKRSLFEYVAVYEFHVNLKAISPTFIAALVHRYSFYT